MIGNSHVAAWRVGSDILPAWGAACETDYFAARSDLMRSLELQGQTLCPTSELTARSMRLVSGDKGEIRVPDYTHFVVIGMGLNIVRPVEAFRQFRLHGYEPGEPDERGFLSRACLAALTQSLILGSTAVRTAGMLRQVTGAQVVVVPQPLPSETMVRMRHWRRAHRSGALAHLTGVWRERVENTIRDMDCDLLWQPEETIVEGVFTAQRYSTDSVRLGADSDTKHPPAEPLHMNAQFGAVMLGACLGLLN